MRGDPGTMTVLRPRTASEALRLYARRPKAVPLAGGTDFMVAWNMALHNGREVLDLSRLKEWARVERRGAVLSVGALCTHTRIREHALIAKEFPLLAEACSTVGAWAIQNRGTIGGNIANASPAGDTFPALAVYEAVVRTAGPRGGRRIPILEVFAGVKKTTLGPSELIEAVELPFSARRPDRRLFRKVGTRAAQAISKTVAAGLLWLGRGNVVEGVRLALGSMAVTVRRLSAVEGALKGRKLDAAAVDKALSLMGRDVSPIDDIRSTAEYRLTVSRNIIRSFLLP